MLDIIPGERTEYDPSYLPFDAVFETGTLPEHVTVASHFAVDTATYAEPELSDAELLGLAAEDAVEAHRAGLVAGPALDEVALQRARRRARRSVVAAALRTVPVGGGVA